MNAHERAARLMKVGAVVGFIDGVDLDVDADDLEVLDDRGWELLARGASVRPLSAESRRAVIATMRLRAETITDPFAAFAGMTS